MLPLKNLSSILLPATLAAAAAHPAQAPAERSAQPEHHALDLSLRGFPLQGQPLAIEVAGAPSTPFVLLVDVLPEGASCPPASLVDLRPGGAASFVAAARGASAAQAHARFSMRAATDAQGGWSHAFQAPEAGTRLRVWGFSQEPRSLDQALDALELSILAPYVAEPGDLVVTEIQRTPGASDGPRGQWIELYNRTDYAVDLEGWTLRDDDGDLHVFAGSAPAIPARSFALLGAEAGAGVHATWGAFRLDPEADEVVLEDARGRGIDRVAYDSARGWPASAPGASLQLARTHMDAESNDVPWAWVQSSSIASTFGGASSTPNRPTPCTALVGAGDVPDLDYLDTNCDGIDGDIARAVFVAVGGSASNPGTMALPLNDVNVAIQLAAADPSRDHVYVSAGTYAGPIRLADGVSVWGGYSQANGWQRSAAYITTIQGAQLTLSGIGQMVGVHGLDLADAVTLGGVRVVTPDAAPGQHNYAILLQESDAVKLEGVTVVAGRGGSASAGSNGSNGGNGGNGLPGATACGGFNYCGGPGGSGGNAGGKGGNGGQDFHLNGFTGNSGGGGNGGAGGAGGGWISAGLNGGNGGNGSAGTSAPSAPNTGSLSAGLWASFGDGGSGSLGAHGGGGGGGGGGSTDFWGFSGNGAGGGGGGGFRGLAGTGGKAGGTSFALFLSASSATLASCSLTAGDGRDGGNGGAGGVGGNGGNGGTGSNCCSTPTGANGGKGGKGGNGGAGAGGGGGHSYAILSGPQSAVSVSGTTLATSAPGLGGFSPGGALHNGKNGEALLIKQL